MIGRRTWVLLFLLTSVSTSETFRLAVLPISTVECAVACSTPPSQVVNGIPVTWGAAKSVSVYTDMQGSERTDVQNAISEWNANGGSPQMSLTPSTQADPGMGASGYIRFVNGPTTDYIADQLPSASAIITQVTITFNRNFQIPAPGGALINEYTPVINNGDAFFTEIVAHELGHALGLDDFRNAQGQEIDSPGPSAMGADTGNNNNGWPATATTQAAPPGNMAGATPCDKNQVATNEAAAKASAGGGVTKGDPPVPVKGAPGSGSGGGGSTPTCYSFFYYNSDGNYENDVICG